MKLAVKKGALINLKGNKCTMLFNLEGEKVHNVYGFDGGKSIQIGLDVSRTASGDKLICSSFLHVLGLL